MFFDPVIALTIFAISQLADNRGRDRDGDRHGAIEIELEIQIGIRTGIEIDRDAIEIEIDIDIDIDMDRLRKNRYIERGRDSCRHWDCDRNDYRDGDRDV